MIEPISFQKGENKLFLTFYNVDRSTLRQAYLTSEGLASISMKSDLPLTGKTRIFEIFSHYGLK